MARLKFPRHFVVDVEALAQMPLAENCDVKRSSRANTREVTAGSTAA